MDYPFFVAHLFTCTQQELEHLKTLVDVPHPRSTFFLAQKHVASMHHPVESLPGSMLARLETLGFMAKDIRKCGSNTIDPAGFIHDHSDIEAERDVALNRAMAHTIHIPVLNNVAVYRHRRSRGQQWSETRLETGGVYLYNNYVSHDVQCTGHEVYRTNLLIDYVDETWKQKYNVLAQLGFGAPKERYESANKYPRLPVAEHRV
jgi:hypothetical protein